MLRKNSRDFFLNIIRFNCYLLIIVNYSFQFIDTHPGFNKQGQDLGDRYNKGFENRQSGSKLFNVSKCIIIGIITIINVELWL